MVSGGWVSGSVVVGQWSVVLIKPFMKILYSFQYHIVFFCRKENKPLYWTFSKYILYIISIKAISVLRLKIVLKIRTF